MAGPALEGWRGSWARSRTRALQRESGDVIELYWVRGGREERMSEWQRLREQVGSQEGRQTHTHRPSPSSKSGDAENSRQLGVKQAPISTASLGTRYQSRGQHYPQISPLQTLCPSEVLRRAEQSPGLQPDSWAALPRKPSCPRSPNPLPGHLMSTPPPGEPAAPAPAPTATVPPRPLALTLEGSRKVCQTAALPL